MPKPIPFYDLKLSPATRRAVDRVLKSGWLTTGPVSTEFEQQFGKRLGAKHTVAVNSATSGITLALKVAGVSRGSEVITSPFSFVAGVECILNCGAKPVLVDVDPDTLNINPSLVEKAISRRTAAILSVDIAGYPCDYPSLSKIAHKHPVPLISDSAHAFGATVKGKSIPHWTDLSVFSFHATKNLTSGEGGMVASRDRRLVDQIRLWSKHGMTASAFERKKSGGWSYDVAEPGFKANMSDILAAVGLGELATYEKRQEKREQLALRYVANLAPAEEYLLTPALHEGFHHAWHLFIVRLNLKALKCSRNQVVDLLAKAGIGSSVHYRPIHTLSFARTYPELRRKLAHAEKAGESVLSLPLYPLLKPGDIDRVCDQLIAVLRRYSR